MKINIKGPIISNNDQWIYDWFGIEAVSPQKVSEQIAKANNEVLEVEINSGGGSVFDASEIYTALKSYPGNVIGQIVGIAASAASVIAMASDKLIMAPTGQMMIHNASMRTRGDYRDMDHASDFLKNVNQTIANAYSLKSGKPYDELLSMMDKETWLTPQQALEHNLIDEIMFESQGAVEVVADAHGGMLPKEVIEKVRNELSKQPVVTNQVGNSTKKEDKKVMNLEQLKNDYPELYNQIKQEGYEEGVNAENARFKEIEDLAIPGNEELVNKAKYDTKATAAQLAVDIIKAQKEQGTNYLQNRDKDAQPLNNVEGSSAPENNSSESQENLDKEAEAIANAMNAKRGIN